MFADNKNPFATTLVNDKVLIDGYFLDDKHMIHKYKVEDDKPTIRCEKLPKHVRTEQYVLKETIWNIQHDNGNDDFSDYVNTIVDNNKSVQIDGRGGCGKSTLLKQIQVTLTEMNKHM